MNQLSNQLNQMKDQMFMKSMAFKDIKVKVDECSICLMDFKIAGEIDKVLPWCEDKTGRDKVVVLGCHESHVFHEKCLQVWFEKGGNTCPLDNLPIQI